MKFEPLYYSNKLLIINPEGDVGLTTLWSRPKQAIKVLTALGIDLSPQTSRIAVVANLYGNGLQQMLRNLLWNPQIVYLLVMGQNLSGSREEVLNFFESGIEPVEYLGVPTHRIVGTQRIIDGLVHPETFKNGIRLLTFGKLSEAETHQKMVDFFKTISPKQPCQIERVNIPIPKTECQRYPSEPRSHTILRTTPLEAWQELIFRLVRFGYHNQLQKGERIELQNVKVIVEAPKEEENLSDYGFSLEHFKAYQQRILDPKLYEQSYTYGNRLRNYFEYHKKKVDSLDIVIQRLKNDFESRHAYVSLWDNSRDLPEGHGCPCLVSLFFRCFEGKLTLTATFRTHNAMDAWLENVYGLMAIQQYVADRIAMPQGAITVFSHSISINAEVLDRAKAVADQKKTGKHEPRYDHNGNFAVTVDYETQEIVVQHNYEGVAIAEYRGKNAEMIENQLARDCAISDISHALYLGREIAKKEFQII